MRELFLLKGRWTITSGNTKPKAMSTSVTAEGSSLRSAHFKVNAKIVQNPTGGYY